MDFAISGKRALVCAASKGIGRAIAFALSNENVDLFLCARNEDNLKTVSQEIKCKTKSNVFYKSVDLSITSSRQELIQEVKKTFCSIDILIHNIGGPKTSTVETTTLDEWQSGFQQLFQSVAELNQAFLPKMKEQSWGRILAITSLAVMEPIFDLAISNAFRAAVTNMLKTLAGEVAPFNISVNCIAPGYILTDRLKERMAAQMQQNKTDQKTIMTKWTDTIAARRLGTPEELAAVACFLCSQQASYITGSTICVDGGKRHSAY